MDVFTLVHLVLLLLRQFHVHKLHFESTTFCLTARNFYFELIESMCICSRFNIIVRSENVECIDRWHCSLRVAMPMIAHSDQNNCMANTREWRLKWVTAKCTRAISMLVACLDRSMRSLLPTYYASNIHDLQSNYDTIMRPDEEAHKSFNNLGVRVRCIRATICARFV